MNYLHHKSGRYRVWATGDEVYLHPEPGLTRDEMLAEAAADGDVDGARRWLERAELYDAGDVPFTGPNGTGTVREWWPETPDEDPWP